jgi:hypothetical protein
MSPLTILSLYRLFSPHAPFAWCYVGAMIFWPVWQGWHNDYQASVYAVVPWIAVLWQVGDRPLASWTANLCAWFRINSLLELSPVVQCYGMETAWHQEFY